MLGADWALVSSQRFTEAVLVLWGSRIDPQRLSPSDGRSTLTRREKACNASYYIMTKPQPPDRAAAASQGVVDCT
jgi:hypothetical protein